MYGRENMCHINFIGYHHMILRSLFSKAPSKSLRDLIVSAFLALALISTATAQDGATDAVGLTGSDAQKVDDIGYRITSEGESEFDN